MMAVFMMNDRRKRRIGTAASGGEEIDRISVVVGVADIAEIDIYGEFLLLINDGIGGVIFQGEIADDISLKITVNFRPVELAGVGGVMKKIRGSGRGDLLGKFRVGTR